MKTEITVKVQMWHVVVLVLIAGFLVMSGRNEKSATVIEETAVAINTATLVPTAIPTQRPTSTPAPTRVPQIMREGLEKCERMLDGDDFKGFFNTGCLEGFVQGEWIENGWAAWEWALNYENEQHGVSFLNLYLIEADLGQEGELVGAKVILLTQEDLGYEPAKKTYLIWGDGYELKVSKPEPSSTPGNLEETDKTRYIYIDVEVPNEVYHSGRCVLYRFLSGNAHYGTSPECEDPSRTEQQRIEIQP